MKAKIVRRNNAASGHRSRVEAEPLLNALARSVGRAVGVVANAALLLSGENKAPSVPPKGKKKNRRRPSARVLRRTTRRAKRLPAN